MDNQIKITKGHKTLFVFDIIMPIISFISLIFAILGFIVFIYGFQYLFNISNSNDALFGVFIFLLLVFIGCIPLYLYGIIYLILIALAILSIIFRKAFIKTNKLWILIYIEVSVILPIITAFLYLLIETFVSMFS